MISPKTNSFGRNLFAMTFIFIFFAGSFGLATVWLRQQIAVAATESRALERRLTDVERMRDKVVGEIATFTTASFLEEQNRRFGLGLGRPQENQVVRVNAQTQERFAEFRWNQLVSLQEETSFTFGAPERN